MKNPFLLSSLMFLVLVFMPSCGLQSDESHTNDNIVSESLDLLPSVSDESAPLDAPEWVAWLANSWGDNGRIHPAVAVRLNHGDVAHFFPCVALNGQSIGAA